MRQLTHAIFLLVLGALLADEALACSCLRPDMASMEKGAELVAVAQLKSRSHSNGKRKYVFSTIRAFKGDAPERIVVWTSDSEVSCGLRAQRGVRYVLFAYRENGRLMVDHCSSWPLIPGSSRFTAAFNEFYGLTGTEVLAPGR